jgi:hypothetical protein
MDVWSSPLNRGNLTLYAVITRYEKIADEPRAFGNYRNLGGYCWNRDFYIGSISRAILGGEGTRRPAPARLVGHGRVIAGFR